MKSVEIWVVVTYQPHGHQVKTTTYQDDACFWHGYIPMRIIETFENES